MPLNLKFWCCTCLLAVSVLMSPKGRAAERIYTLAEAAAIDRENAMWQMVDAALGTDQNIARMRAAGFPSGEVEEFKGRLAAFWESEPLPYYGRLDRETVVKLKGLEREYQIRMREAFIRKETGLTRGQYAPETPGEVRNQWRRAIIGLLEYREIKEFLLLNSASAQGLYRLTRGVPMTLGERRVLCELQQDIDRISARSAENRWQIVAQQEVLLNDWHRMRRVLGDERFMVYLQAANAAFAQMAGVLKPIEGVNNGKILDLWWIRKRGEMPEEPMNWGSANYQRQLKTYESAVMVLGEAALTTYQENTDAEWLLSSMPAKIPKAAWVGDTPAQ